MCCVPWHGIALICIELLVSAVEYVSSFKWMMSLSYQKTSIGIREIEFNESVTQSWHKVVLSST